MSAYLVADKSLSVCARSIEHFAERKPQFGTNAIWQALDRYHNHFLTQPSYGDAEAQIAEKLFSKLVEINMLSLLERYDDADACWGTSARAYTYDPGAPVVAIPVLIDLLDNWQYQSCEGMAVETDFYKLTVEIQNRLAREYVRRTRDYTDTVWGIDDYAELNGIKGAYEH
jgi:hypothetical protein